MLFCFFLFLFGIIGVTLFSGKLHYRCTEPGAFRFVRDEAICGIDADCEGAQTCVYYGTNPSNGAVSYDNCLWAFVTIFQAVSLEGWVDQMYMLERVVEPSLTIAYYISVVVFGAMFIVNLFLVSLARVAAALSRLVVPPAPCALPAHIARLALLPSRPSCVPIRVLSVPTLLAML